MSSTINIVEAWNKCMEAFSPIQIYWNDEIIWDDNVELNKWENPKAAFSLWAACHPNYKNYMVESINIEIVEFHHSIVRMYGREMK